MQKGTGQRLRAGAPHMSPPRRTVATMTAASGRRPLVLHLMFMNFSMPMSAPKPAWWLCACACVRVCTSVCVYVRGCDCSSCVPCDGGVEKGAVEPAAEVYSLLGGFGPAATSKGALDKRIMPGL